ncbi:MAG: 30S ribosomal protein S4 [Nanoarchaeota archaeon]
MGDPRKSRKTYSTPAHPWQKARIEEEKVLMREYGLKNKKEIWKMNTLVKTFADQIKDSVTATSAQAKIETEQLITKLKNLALIKEDSTMDDILGLTTKNVLERRLQTLVFRKGMAKSIDQARQFITHGHIKIGESKVTRPSFLVSKAEEDHISFIARSALASIEHPERGEAT